jgi:gamma-glutamyltranspeptidase / glutathione hydrolase
MLATLLVAEEPLPKAPPDAGNYPEPVEMPRYLPPAVIKSHAMVSAAHPLAAKIGTEILRTGGNAIDATVAVQMVLNVVEPQSSGIGGGSFIVYYDAKEKKTYCIDGREETPAAAKREDFLDAKGNELADPITGGVSTGVPGTVAAMWLAHSRWGKLPIQQLLVPAIRLAEDGIGVTPRLRVSIAVNRPRFLEFPSSKAIFLEADGSIPEIGTVLKQPDLARTLRLLAEQGPKVFYQGEIAQDIVKAVQTSPVRKGHMSLGDLQSYRAVFREPTRFGYHGYEFASMPPPSSGGITLGLMLGMLEGSGIEKHAAGTVEEMDLLARVSNTAFADRNAYLGDQDWSPEIPMSKLLDPKYVAHRRAVALHASPGKAMRAGELEYGSPPAGAGSKTEGRHTTHFSIIDGDHNVVACTTTIENGMGCGLIVPGRGFMLNNELTDFDLEVATGPNAIDAGRRPRRTAFTDNEEPAGKRPRSSMAPAIVFKNGEPYMTIGSPGGPQIIGIVAQVLVNVLDHGMDMQQAINAPRMDSRNSPIALEALYSNRAELQKGLEQRGWRVREQPRGYDVWGGVHGIRIRPDGKLEGGADPRREGAVRGY